MSRHNVQHTHQIARFAADDERALHVLVVTVRTHTRVSRTLAAPTTQYTVQRSHTASHRTRHLSCTACFSPVSCCASAVRRAASFKPCGTRRGGRGHTSTITTHDHTITTHSIHTHLPRAIKERLRRHHEPARARIGGCAQHIDTKHNVHLTPRYAPAYS
jgi:hypothetical protein